MSYSIDALRRSGRLVKTWGQSRLANGKSLVETLTVGGISWWDVAAPNLAAFYLPPCLSAQHQKVGLRRRTEPYLRWLKHRVSSIVSFRRSSVACDRWPVKSPYLFLGFSQYMFRDVLQPVVQRIAETQATVSICLYDSPRSQLASKPHEWHCIWQHWDADVARQSRMLHKSFQKALANLRAMGALPKVIRDGDQPLWPQTRSLFDWLFLVYFPPLMAHAAVAGHILRRHRPPLVFSADVDDARNRLYCLLARQLGIPSLEVQFGVYGSESVEWQFFIADHLAVWGEQSRDVMLAQNVPLDRLTVTGSPRHDQIVTRAAALRRDARARLNVPADKVIVLFARVYSGFVDKERLAAVERAIIRAVAGCRNMVLVVKPHPGDKPQGNKRLAEGHQNVLFADPGDDIRELIQRCDAFITLGSTSTMDALLARKPVIWPALAELVWWADMFMDSDAVAVVRSEEELVRIMKSVADGSISEIMTGLEPARQRFLEHCVFRTDGRASERIADLALAAVRQARNPGTGDFAAPDRQNLISQ